MTHIESKDDFFAQNLGFGGLLGCFCKFVKLMFLERRQFDRSENVHAYLVKIDLLL